MKMCRLLLILATTCLFWAPHLHGAGVLITEFMANNDTGLDDEDGDESDWIEIHNASASAVNLEGWYLTDNAADLTKWEFPSVDLPAGGYLIVFASGKDRRVGELHANFALSNNGEYLALIEPDGVTVASHFSPTFPIQARDVSYGLSGGASQVIILPEGAPARALVPLNNALEPAAPGPGVVRPWTATMLDETGWASGTTGVGYDTAPDYLPFIGLNVQAMQNINQTVYIRVPFTVEDPSVIETLTLRMRFEDGMIAYINGREVAWGNSPDPSVATWNSAALSVRDEGLAVSQTSYDLTSFIDFLHVGVNVLAIQGLNSGVGSSDLLVLPQIVASVSGEGSMAARYFPEPTPGAANNEGVETLGPIISQVAHLPKIPTETDDLVVSARLDQVFGPIASAVLRYRVMYGAEVELPFLDNGASGDAGAGDGVYGAIIPASAYTPGQMVRWYIRAQDGAGNVSRFPRFTNPANSDQYLGTVVVDPSLVNPLPVLHWFVQNPAAAATDAGTTCSLFFLGRFYDNSRIDIHGQSSRDAAFAKKSHDIDFHPGNNLMWKEGEPRADDVNFITTFADKSHMRNVLAYEVYRDSDGPHHWVVPVRVQQNGAFYGTAHLLENGDEDWLVRMGYNTQGALYKMYNSFASAADATTGAEKKTRKNENNADLTALFNGVSLAGQARSTYLYDNVNIPQVVNFLAARVMTGDIDCCHKNYYFYRDTGVTDEWEMLPWDVDLSFGRIWSQCSNYWDEDLYPNTGLFTGGNNRVPQAIFGTPEMRQMYLRRLRTLMDEMLKPPGTPEEELYFEPRIDELAAQIAPDAAMDAARWNGHSWGNCALQGCCPQTSEQAAEQIKTQYLPQRRNQLFNRLASGASELPNAQPQNSIIRFAAIEVRPSNGNQLQEFIQFTNANPYAVDISGWQVRGGVRFTFRGGTVIPANRSLYLARDRASWRGRTTPPTRGQGLFVVGDYAGQLSARGELIELIDRQANLVASTNTPPFPSAAQSDLRITEIMYNPPRLPGSSFENQEYEYIELTNVGGSDLDVSGVHFAEGIVFSFPALSTIPAGGSVLVVKNQAAFQERYGNGPTVAGVYTGNLDNNGERLRLEDALNEVVLDFDYEDDWYPVTDGLGFSLVAVDAHAHFTAWDSKTNWRTSGTEYGSPGAGDPPLPSVPGVLINEVLSNTDLPVTDAIELYNPTAETVDLSGWYLTDNRQTPKKFQIPPGTSIGPGAYIHFDEDDFNSSPGMGSSFALSALGEGAYLFSADTAGHLTGYFHGYEFGAAAAGVSFGRYVDSQSTEHFVAMSTVTLSGPNSEPKVGPVIISEIHYHPAGEVSGTNLIENTYSEFVELANVTGDPVPLFDPEFPANRWRLTGGIQFVMSPNVTMAPNGHLVVVSFDPNANPTALNKFRTLYGLGGNVQIVGPYTGVLRNSGDTVRLFRPDSPVPPPDSNQGTVPLIEVDRVDYLDEEPWAIAADGLGPSLQRRSNMAFGNDPENWTAAGVTPGGVFGGGPPPIITQQPADAVVVAHMTATFTVVAQGAGPLTYQWRYNGQILGGKTAATLSLPNVQPAQSGLYSVIVLNPSGTVVSESAELMVLIPARIITQPSSQSVDEGLNATFTIQAQSTTPITFQWRFNGAPMAGETSATLVVPNVQLGVHDGDYDVIVTDGVGDIVSQPARLRVLVDPTFVVQPVGQTNIVGSTVTFGVQTSGTLPMGYRWRRGGATLANRVLNSHVDFLTFTNINTSLAGIYSVVVTNESFFAPGTLSAQVRLGVITNGDSDGDGIPDTYEEAHGLDPNNAADAAGDLDGDGMSNRDEYEAGTDPQDPNSYLHVSEIAATGDVIIRFMAAPNRSYSIVYRDQAGPASWSVLSGVPALSTVEGAARMVEIVDPQPPSPGQRYYQIITPAQSIAP